MVKLSDIESCNFESTYNEYMASLLLLGVTSDKCPIENDTGDERLDYVNDFYINEDECSDMVLRTYTSKSYEHCFLPDYIDEIRSVNCKVSIGTLDIERDRMNGIQVIRDIDVNKINLFNNSGIILNGSECKEVYIKDGVRFVNIQEVGACEDTLVSAPKGCIVSTWPSMKGSKYTLGQRLQWLKYNMPYAVNGKNNITRAYVQFSDMEADLIIRNEEVTYRKTNVTDYTIKCNIGSRKEKIIEFMDEFIVPSNFTIIRR